VHQGLEQDAALSGACSVPGRTSTRTQDQRQSLGHQGSLAQSADATAQSVHDALQRFLAGVDTHLDDLRRESSDVIVKSGEVLQSGAALVSAAVGEVGKGQKELGRELSGLSRTGEQAGRAVTSAVDALHGAVRAVSESLARHESAMQAQASELTAARDAAERMLRVLGNSVGAGRAQET
jgi:hypothetical protein